MMRIGGRREVNVMVLIREIDESDIIFIYLSVCYINCLSLLIVKIYI